MMSAVKKYQKGKRYYFICIYFFVFSSFEIKDSFGI